jgi:hypothetical protein
MAQTNSNVIGGVQGNLRYWSADFTTATGDHTLTFNHGLNYLVESRVSLAIGGLNTQDPKITHSSGTATAVFNNTLGLSGHAYFLGK